MHLHVVCATIQTKLFVVVKDVWPYDLPFLRSQTTHHAHTDTLKCTNVRGSTSGHAPSKPEMAPCVLLQGTPVLALNKLLEPGQVYVLPGALTYALQPWFGMATQSPSCALAEYGTARGLVHPHHVPSLLFHLSQGQMPHGEYFYPVVTGWI